MTLSTTRTLLLVLVVSCMVLYLIATWRVATLGDSNEPLLVPKPLEAVNLDVLLERWPVLITDRVVDPKELVSSLFHMQSIYTHHLELPAESEEHLCAARYTLLYTTKDAGEWTVTIRHPHQKAAVPSAVYTIQPNQVCILPMRWAFIKGPPNKMVHCIQLFDASSLLYYMGIRALGH